MSRQLASAIDHGFAAELELISGLLHVVERTEWDLHEWQRALAPLDRRRARVVILHLLHGLGFEAIGERLGFSRGRADQLWRSAILQLTRHLRGEVA